MSCKGAAMKAFSERMPVLWSITLFWSTTKLPDFSRFEAPAFGSVPAVKCFSQVYTPFVT